MILWIVVFFIWVPLSVALTGLAIHNERPYVSWWRKALFKIVTLPSLWASFLQGLSYRGTVGIWLASAEDWFHK